MLVFFFNEKFVFDILGVFKKWKKCCVLLFFFNFEWGIVEL